MTKLTDIQLILLSTAASRLNGNLLPPPESLGSSAIRIRKGIAALIKQGFAEETTASEEIDTWREEDGRRIAVIITEAGRAAIIPDSDQAEEATTAAVVISSDGDVTKPPSQTKTALVLDLLGRDAGATLDDLISATGWLPHTTRAALTGLRKRGFAIIRDNATGVSRYSITAATGA